jgi:hypothetical protein
MEIFWIVWVIVGFVSYIVMLYMAWYDGYDIGIVDLTLTPVICTFLGFLTIIILIHEYSTWLDAIDWNCIIKGRKRDD